MNQPFILCLYIACLAVLVTFAGCTGTGPGNPGGQILPPVTRTPVREARLVVNERQNTATVCVNQGDIITVKLPENPTTGFLWNLSVTPGLHVMNRIFVPSDTTGRLIGSGGTRVWDISAIAAGEQKIQAIYKRSWEPANGTEMAFAMTIVVVAPA